MITHPCRTFSFGLINLIYIPYVYNGLPVLAGKWTMLLQYAQGIVNTDHDNVCQRYNDVTTCVIHSYLSGHFADDIFWTNDCLVY